MKRTRRRRSQGVKKLQSITTKELRELISRDQNTFGYELQRLEEMEKEAWHMYYSQGGYVEEEEKTTQSDEEGNVISESVKKKSRNDPRIAMAWFDRIIKLQEKRAQMLEIEIRRRGHTSFLVDDDYEGFDPEDAWPKPEDIREKESADV